MVIRGAKRNMCSCSCDLDGPKVFWETWPKARKSHTCCECLSPIDIGEKYWRVAGVWDGGWNTYSMCKTCKDVWDEAVSEVPDLCICFGELWDTVGVEFEYAATC